MALALELAMTGDPISAARAYELGLVNRLVPRGEVLATAIALAERIGENSPAAVRASRRIVKEAAEVSEAEGWDLTTRYSMPVFESGDAIEGASAFAEKRKPVWKSV
jgi:enoyl-CoA hydratase/carnithine racemase